MKSQRGNLKGVLVGLFCEIIRYRYGYNEHKICATQEKESPRRKEVFHGVTL